MKPLLAAGLPLSALVLSACGGSAGDDTVPGEEIADQLDDPAAQSDPTSAAILEAEANEARHHDRLQPAGEPDSFTQHAMERAARETEETSAPTAGE